MIKKTVTYTDYNDEERTEDFYFNFTQAELTEWEASVDGGATAMWKKIVEAKNVPELAKFFKTMLLKAYGKKSEDGRHFYKDEKIAKEFESSPAYSQMYMLLATNSDEAAAFWNGVMPKAKPAAAAN